MHPTPALSLLLVLAGCPSSKAPDDTATPGPAPVDLAADWAALVEGVPSVDTDGGVPSKAVLFRDDVFPLLLDDGPDAIAAGVHTGEGRAVWLGHENLLTAWPAGDASTARLVENTLRWLARDREGLALGLSEDLGAMETLLQGAGWDARVVDPATDLDDVDLLLTTPYDDLSDETDGDLVTWVLQGGGLLVAGHAWWWGSTHPEEEAATAFPGNQYLAPLGLVVTPTWTEAGTWPVPPDVPAPVTHARGALEALLLDQAGSSPLSDDDRHTAVHAALFAIRTLPLDFTDYYTLVEGYAAGVGEVVPTAEAPVDMEADPAAYVAMAYVTRKAMDLDAPDLRAPAAADDFPGFADPSLGVRRTFSVDAAFPGLDAEYWYAQPTEPALRTTCLYVPAGQVVNVSLPSPVTGAGLSARVGAHADSLWDQERWSRYPVLTRSWDLDTADTAVAGAFGGPLYIRVPPGTDLSATVVNVTVDGALDAPCFQAGATDPTDWRAEIRSRPAPWAELVGERVALTVPTEAVADLDDPDALLAFWDAVARDMDTLDGTDDDEHRPERIVFDRQPSAGWMHSGYPIVADLGAVAEGVDLTQLQSTGSWGLFHELGHNRQWGDWVLPGSTEATCNLFAVHAMEEVVGLDRADAHASLTPEAREATIRAWLDGDRDFWTDWSVWTALETYLQLQEAFGWGLFTDVFATYRTLSDADSPRDDEERVDQWVLQTSLATGMDLTPFYDAWSFPVSDAVRADLADLPPWTDHPMAGR